MTSLMIRYGSRSLPEEESFIWLSFTIWASQCQCADVTARFHVGAPNPDVDTMRESHVWIVLLDPIAVLMGLRCRNYDFLH